MIINTRVATDADVETLFDFQLAMAHESEDIQLDTLKLRAGLGAVLTKPELGTYYVAQSESEVVGCLLVTREWSEWRNGHVWWIQSVYVPTAHRRRGIYRQMYSYLQTLAAADPQVVGIRLYVETKNLSARKVYQSLGMNEDRYLVCEWLKTEH